MPRILNQPRKKNKPHIGIEACKFKSLQSRPFSGVESTQNSFDNLRRVVKSKFFLQQFDEGNRITFCRLKNFFSLPTQSKIS